MLRSQKLVIINFIFLFALILNLSLHQVILGQINSQLGIKSVLAARINSLSKSQVANAQLSGEIMADSIKLTIAEGVPEIYGAELGVSFNEAQAMIDVLKEYDPTYGQKKIVLAGEKLRRYIDVGLRISCEYCCSAKAIINPTGEAACGCAHSKAMRGLAAYLIQNHGTEYTNDEILRELARWKGIYFPKQMVQKMSSQLQGMQDFTPDTASLIIGVDLPDYGQGSSTAPLPSEMKDLPSMVGGC